MTQKELSYVEDAIKHEDNVICILNDNINNLEDEKLIDFMKDEAKKHKSIHKKLMNLLGGKANGW